MRCVDDGSVWVFVLSVGRLLGFSVLGTEGARSRVGRRAELTGGGGGRMGGRGGAQEAGLAEAVLEKVGWGRRIAMSAERLRWVQNVIVQPDFTQEE
jgi:hypothetical protein